VKRARKIRYNPLTSAKRTCYIRVMEAGRLSICHWCGQEWMRTSEGHCRRGVLYVIPAFGPDASVVKVGATILRTALIKGGRIQLLLAAGRVGELSVRQFWATEIDDLPTDEAAVHDALVDHRAFWKKPDWPKVWQVGWTEFYRCDQNIVLDTIARTLGLTCKSFRHDPRLRGERILRDA